MSNSNLCLADKMEESGRHGDSIDCLSMRMSVRILIGCRTRIFSNFLPAALALFLEHFKTVWKFFWTFKWILSTSQLQLKRKSTNKSMLSVLSLSALRWTGAAVVYFAVNLQLQHGVPPSAEWEPEDKRLTLAVLPLHHLPLTVSRASHTGHDHAVAQAYYLEITVPIDSMKCELSWYGSNYQRPI